MIFFPPIRPALIAVFLTLGAANAEEKMSLQFVSFPKAPQAEELELVGRGGKTILIELPTNSLSPVYKVERMDNWVIGESTANAEGEPIFKVHGQAPALASKNQLIIVIRDGAKIADGLKLIPFDSGKAGFWGGKYLFLNLTEIEVGGSVGEVEFDLEPHGYEILAPDAPRRGNDPKRLHAELYFRRDNKDNLFFSSTWRFNEKARSLIFFYTDPIDQRLHLHTIRDYAIN